MRDFRFPLDRALNLRATQLDLAQAEFQKAAATLAAIQRDRAALASAEAAAQTDVRRTGVPGEELSALEGFLIGVEFHERRLAQRQQQAAELFETRRRELLEARRCHELLVRLRARRFAEWRDEMSHELESDAAESYLARWKGRLRPAQMPKIER